MECIFKRSGLSLRAALVFDSRMGAAISAAQAGCFHNDDKNTLLINAAYYERPDVAQTLLMSGAELSFRNFEACRLARSKVEAYPQSSKAKEVLGVIARWAEKQGINLGSFIPTTTASKEWERRRH